MGFNFRPMDTAFFGLLTQSADLLVTGSDILAELLDDSADRASISTRMREAEHQADDVTHEIAKRVNTTFVTPFDREDIFALSSALDDVMDYMEEAVDCTVLYEVDKWPQDLANQIDVLQRCAELTAATMPKLQSMKGLEDYWIEINRLENTGDASYRRILAKLFSGQYDAIEVLKLKDIVGSLEHAIDSFETVANIVERIHAKES